MEMLVVVMVWSTVLHLTFVFSSQLKQELEASQFLKQFNTDIIWIQQQTMTTRSYHTLLFVEEKKKYQIYTNGYQQLIKEETLPTGWNIQLQTIANPLRFHYSGRIMKAGSLLFKTPEGNYRIVFPFGKARHYVLEP